MSSGVFRDITKLSFDYVPEKLLHREEQWRKLEVMFEPVTQGGYSQNALIVGSIGTGKTVTSKRFCAELSMSARKAGKSIEWTIVNCRQRNSEASTLLKMINYFDPNFPDRGFSAQELRKVLRKHIEKRGGHCIFVLDEVDALFKSGASDLVYFLSRLPEESDTLKNRVSLILISQRHVFDLLDKSALSTFKRTNIIEFGKYTKEQLFDIISARADLALVSGSYDDGVLDMIADIASEWGDARFAIEMLEKSGMIANERSGEKIFTEDVRAAKAATYAFVTEERVAGLNRDQMLILLATARMLRNKAYTETSEVEKSYRIACEEHDTKPRAHTQFYSHVKELAGLGLLDIRSKKGSVAGMTNMITMLDVPADIMVQQIERMLSSSKKQKAR